MKDLPHHILKLNRRIVRSALREEHAEEAEALPPPRTPSKEEQRKLAKREMSAKTKSRTPIHDSEAERNRKMKYRVPVFDRNNAAPKHARSTKKKTPGI